jgi:flagellin
MSGINNNISVNAALRNLGTASTQIEKTQTQNQPPASQPGADFASQLRDVSQAQATPQSSDPALNSMINTSLETEAAKLQALQVQQQLGSQPNAIVNQRASTILSLFNKG